MSKMEIYDPAMCCSTGVCGPSVNPELIRVSAVIENLKKNGIEVKRHNLSSEPQAFVSNAAVNKELNGKGSNVLPITVVDGKIVKETAYPSNEDFAVYLGVDLDKIQSIPVKTKIHKCSCGPNGCC
jgi:Arsenical resistance operon trans-acting repressor ArsD.